jgi:hypothetical protein
MYDFSNRLYFPSIFILELLDLVSRQQESGLDEK